MGDPELRGQGDRKRERDRDSHVRGPRLRIAFVASDQVTTGVYSWTLSANCLTGQGTLEFTGPPSRSGESHVSKVRRFAAG